MSNFNDDQVGFLIEHFEGYFQAILEGVDALANVPNDIAQLKDDMFEVKNDVKAMKAVLTDHSSTLNNHENRIIKLEKNAA